MWKMDSDELIESYNSRLNGSVREQNTADGSLIVLRAITISLLTSIITFFGWQVQ